MHYKWDVQQDNIFWVNYDFFQVEIMGLPPHTTHLLQPLDVGIFNHIKRSYNQICVSSGMRNLKLTINKALFPITWKNSIQQGATPSVIKSAFRRSGLYPFDPCAIDSTHMTKRKYVVKLSNFFLLHINFLIVS